MIEKKFLNKLNIIKVTITLDDITPLLHLLVVGAFHSFELLHVDDAVNMLVELLEFHGSYVRLSWLCDVYQTKIEACDWIVAVRAYLLHLLGCTLFANKSVTHVHVSGSYAWGAAALVHMYDNLNDTSKSTVRQLAGYITLLQCWIYEHFPSVGFAIPTEDYDERRLRACQWTSGKALTVSTYRRCLDRLTPDVVCWISYGDHPSFREFKIGPIDGHSRPERIVQQFGYIQAIPSHHAASSFSVEEIDDRWMQFSEYIAPIGQLCAVLNHCLPDYMDWLYMISHPFMSLAQPGDPPRQPMAAATPNEADVDVHHVRHAVDGFVAIANKLERLLNLRILTEGT
ncbi:Protein MAINTENANCE OF MERISTEMS [Glycine soja]